MNANERPAPVPDYVQATIENVRVDAAYLTGQIGPQVQEARKTLKRAAAAAWVEKEYDLPLGWIVGLREDQGSFWVLVRGPECHAIGFRMVGLDSFRIAPWSYLVDLPTGIQRFKTFAEAAEASRVSRMLVEPEGLAQHAFV